MRYFASDTVTLHSMVARLNIELFGKKLAEEMNEAKRRTLLQLVAEEKAKLSELVRRRRPRSSRLRRIAITQATFMAP